MRTYRGDLLSSMCKDCKANGAAIANCRMCKCVCRTGIFFEKCIQKVATLKLVRANNLKARGRIPITDARSVANFVGLLASAFRDGVASLTTSKSVHSESNIFSAAAGHLSRLQMLSAEELHSLQQRVLLSMTLHADPWKKGKRHDRNNLR